MRALMFSAIFSLTLTSFADAYTSSGGASFVVSLSDAQIDCTENFDGGFSGCTVDVEFQYDSDYNGNSEPRVSLTCEVEIETREADGFRSFERNYSDDTLRGRTGSGSIEVSFSFYSIDPIVEATVSDASCDITSVSD